VRVTGGVGLALMGIGFLVFTTLDVDSSYWRFGAGAVVTGIGMALATAPATTAIVSSLPGHRQGVASAVNDLAREVGGALGIAVLGSVLNSGYRHDVASATAGLPPPASDAAQSSIAAAAQIADGAGVSGAALLARAEAAFVNGLSTSLLVGACVLFGASVIVALAAPRREDVIETDSIEAVQQPLAAPIGKRPLARDP
jgi:hypothetical protein